MISKKKWEESFKNINGREPNDQEYQEAIADGLIKEGAVINKSDKKTVVIIGSILGALLIIIIVILLSIFFYPKPTNNQASGFNNKSSKSPLSTNVSTSKSSSAEDLSEVIIEWNNVSLNEQIALLVQAYADINSQTSILSANKIAMTANGNKGVNDGYIQWYDDDYKEHKLDVVIDNDKISYTYVNSTTGLKECKSTKISSAMSSYYQKVTAKQKIEDTASKIVTPAELESSNSSSLVSKAIVGKGFVSEIKSYDGMTPEVAMENGGPQNLIHDGTEYYYFGEDGSVKLTGVGSYVLSATHSYKITDEAVEIAGFDNKNIIGKFPYTINDGNVTFEDSIVNSSGHITVLSFMEDPTAKSYIESKEGN